MSYNSTAAAVRAILPMGLYASVSSSGAALMGGGSVFSFCSSHSSTQIIPTGFFSACGAAPLGYGTLVKSNNNVGMRTGDLVVNIESSAGTLPGKVSWHAVIGSTFNQASSAASTAGVSTAGFDISVSSATT